MRNWNDYKTYVKKIDSQAKKDMEEMEELAVIVGAIIEKRTALGISRFSRYVRNTTVICCENRNI